ncbi:MAG: M23 family metallopeptidase [Bacteroidales bacterium]|nr:M23 family metallopeptidase [Bacteroidales bacterium]MBQ2912321.1 M23 family metallopeptidase [Bacteroidales bacterium]MBQ7018334.1 M23 family metallopeptidase [Bacteroidales bacterium]MBR2477363.1 M23 family metallopeptidase [Bacteroidales bacterium]
MAKKYRFSIFNDTTHEEIFVFRANGIRSILTIVLLVIFLIVSVTLLISYTSLREFIPGYPSAQSRQDLIQNAIKIDSLQNEINLWRLQLANIQRITTGQKPLAIDSLLNLHGMGDTTARVEGDYAKDDSLLRATVFKEEQFNLSAREHKIEQIEGLHFFPPLKGVVTEEYNPAIGHPYIDIAAPENSVVSAVLNGTVIHAGWDDENGYTIQLQHDNNLVSVYKHNSKLLARTSDKVTAGTPVALVGNTGTLSSAPHLHFELWHKGEPINPAQYINF